MARERSGLLYFSCRTAGVLLYRGKENRRDALASEGRRTRERNRTSQEVSLRTRPNRAAKSTLLQNEQPQRHTMSRYGGRYQRGARKANGMQVHTILKQSTSISETIPLTRLEGGQLKKANATKGMSATSLRRTISVIFLVLVNCEATAWSSQRQLRGVCDKAMHPFLLAPCTRAAASAESVRRGVCVCALGRGGAVCNTARGSSGQDRL